MVKRHADVVRIHLSSVVDLMHLRGLGAGTTSKVRVTTDRCKHGRPGSKVVLGELIAVTISSSVSVAVAASRMEGRARHTAVSAGESTIGRRRGLEVDGVQALVEFLGTAELPLAEDSPNNAHSADRGGKGDYNSQCGVLGFRGSTLWRGRC